MSTVEVVDPKPKCLGQRLEQGRVVVDDEDLGAAHTVDLRHLLSAGERKLDQERRPFAGPILKPDRSLMILDDAVGDGQPQPRSRTDFLGREERVEDPLLELRRDPGPGILELQVDRARLDPAI